MRRGDKLRAGVDSVRDVAPAEASARALPRARRLAAPHARPSLVRAQVLAAVLGACDAVRATHVAVASDDPAAAAALVAGLARARPAVAAILAVDDARLAARARATGGALPFLGTLFLLAEADALVASFASNVPRFVLPLLAARHCGAAWSERGRAGAPHVVDLDGIVASDALARGRWFCDPPAVYGPEACANARWTPEASAPAERAPARSALLAGCAGDAPPPVTSAGGWPKEVVVVPAVFREWDAALPAWACPGAADAYAVAPLYQRVEPSAPRYVPNYACVGESKRVGARAFETTRIPPAQVRGGRVPALRRRPLR